MVIFLENTCIYNIINIYTVEPLLSDHPWRWWSLNRKITTGGPKLNYFDDFLKVYTHVYSNTVHCFNKNCPISMKYSI